MRVGECNFAVDQSAVEDAPHVRIEDGAFLMQQLLLLVTNTLGYGP